MGIGLFFAILTGLSWVVVGAVVGLAEKHGCKSSRFQIVGSCFTLFAASVVYMVGHSLLPDHALFRFTFSKAGAAGMFACGFFNFWMILSMGAAMARGPNGPAWTITQSGFVFPFALGVLSGNTPFNWVLAGGLLLVLSNVVANGMLRGDGGKSAEAGGQGRRAGWFAFSLMAFIFCGINQCAALAVSFIPPATRPESLERIFCLAAGTITGWCILNLWKRLTQKPEPRDPDLRAKYLYLFKICAVNTTISFLASLFLAYEAQDRLNDVGASAIVFPIMVASCFLGFAAYSLAILRERLVPLQWVAFAAGVVGIALLAVGAGS